MTLSISDEELAVRAHDVTTCLEGSTTSEFGTLPIAGHAVTLALHLRDCPPVPFRRVKDVCVHALHMHPLEVGPVLVLLEEARMVDLVRQGTDITMVNPAVPVFSDLYTDLGAVARPKGLTEHEQFTLTLMQCLANAPVKGDTIRSLGADTKLVNAVLQIGEEGEFIIKQRARGQDVYLSPTYFSESAEGYANLAAMSGGKARLQKILGLLKQWQGWPLKLILKEKELGGVKLDADDLASIQAMAGNGFVCPPAIQTTHGGTNHFLFGPRPGAGRLPINQRGIYENALALVSAVRQGQLLFNAYRIKRPLRLLQVLRDRGWIASNSEAPEQYREVVTRRICRLERGEGNRAQLHLIRPPHTGGADNIAAVDMAIALVQGSELGATADEEITLAFQTGQEYVESLVGRKAIARVKPIKASEDVQASIDDFLLRGGCI